MLIDAFCDDWIDELDARVAAMAPSNGLYLLLDGAFVPGLHKQLADGHKALLFSALPGCTEETEDASPFLTPFIAADRAVRSLLRRCNRWPMVSAIETSESLEALADRLSAWCIVEADGQCFNFRFPDTRRLPASFATLTPKQRAQLAGPATRWSYIARDGQWRDLDVAPSSAEIAADPVLDERQFASLAGDSQADELLVLLGDRGHDVLRHPSRSHALLETAIRAARIAELDENRVLDWCEWFWLRGQSDDDATAISILRTWRETNG
jgi:hypothetical protein